MIEKLVAADLKKYQRGKSMGWNIYNRLIYNFKLRTKMMVVIVSGVRIECKYQIFMMKSKVRFEILRLGLMMCKNKWHYKNSLSLVNFYNNKNIFFTRIHKNILFPEYKMWFDIASSRVWRSAISGKFSTFLRFLT